MSRWRPGCQFFCVKEDGGKRLKEIFLIRHGRQSSKLCNVDVSLDEKGRKQAELLARRLSGYGIEKLYASDLKRAKETADIIGRELVLPVEIIPEFREIDFGEMTGKEDTKKEYAAFWEERAEQTSDLAYPGGENGEDVVRRVLPRLRQICEEPEVRVAIVAHGGVIRAVCACLLGTDLKNKLKFAIDLENTSITQLNFDEKRTMFYLERFNDFAHLEPYPELLRNSWNPSSLREPPAHA